MKLDCLIWYGSFGRINDVSSDGLLFTTKATESNAAGGSGDDQARVYFDASGFNSIYGGSDTVQPPALTTLYCIKY